MAATPPDPDDLPATRRDLRLSLQATEAALRQEIADARVEAATQLVESRVETGERLAELQGQVAESRVETGEWLAELHGQLAESRVETARESQRTNQRISNQTRILLGAMVLMWGTVVGVIVRIG